MATASTIEETRRRARSAGAANSCGVGAALAAKQRRVSEPNASVPDSGSAAASEDRRRPACPGETAPSRARNLAFGERLPSRDLLIGGIPRLRPAERPYLPVPPRRPSTSNALLSAHWNCLDSRTPGVTATSAVPAASDAAQTWYPHDSGQLFHRHCSMYRSHLGKSMLPHPNVTGSLHLATSEERRAQSFCSSLREGRLHRA